MSDPNAKSPAEDPSSQPLESSSDTAGFEAADFDSYFELAPTTASESSTKPWGSDAHHQKSGPLALVETAFLASAASLIWLVNLYFPPGPLLRIFFPLPTALVYLRWGQRAAWMSTLVSGLLLAVLIGPPRSVLYVMPYGFMGMQLGFMWLRRASWYASISIGALIGTLGFFFRVWLVSIMLGEDLWVYLTMQVTQFLSWGIERLMAFGLIDVGSVGQPSLLVVQIVAVVMVHISNIVYLFTVHLAAWILLERLGTPMPPPPKWVQALLED